MAESIQVFDRIWLSSDDSTYTSLEFLPGTSLGATEEFLDVGGIRGTRQHTAVRTRRTRRSVSGNLNFAPTASELDLLLPWILGADESTDVFALAELLPARYIKTYRDGTKHLYNGLKVNTATFSASEGGPLNLSLSVIGIDEATDGDATESDAINDDAGPYVLSDCVLSVGGSEYQFRSMQISVNNFLEVKFNNSLTATSIHATDLEVGIQLALPYGDASALYGSSISGVTVAATFTNGSRAITFNLAGVQTPKTPIPLGSKNARDLTWAGIARRTSGGTAPISVTNDSTG